jgi:hypothetical protein
MKSKKEEIHKIGMLSLFESILPSFITETQDTSLYIKTVQFLLMYMFERNQVFSKTDVANYAAQTSERMFVVDNQIFFWTKHQKMLIDYNPKRVLFTSAFGTGKTTLLKAKAKQLGRERHLQDLKKKSKQIDSQAAKIMFVVFTDKEALLTQSLQSELEDFKNYIQIVPLKSNFLNAFFIYMFKNRSNIIVL